MRCYRFISLCSGLAVLALNAPLPAQISAQQLVREVVNNEWHARQQTSTAWTYIMRSGESGTNEVLQVIDTRAGPVYRVLSRNDKPLDPVQQQLEEERLKKLVGNPKLQEKAREEYSHDVRQGLEMLRILPDASRFRIDNESGQRIQLSFEPNPAFKPDNRTANLVHALTGTLVLDTSEKRVVEFQAEISHDVKYGGGLLGSIHKGGTFHFAQAEVAQGQWMATLVDVKMAGRALLFRSLNRREHWVFSNFHRVPLHLSVADAVERLKPEQRAATREH